MNKKIVKNYIYNTLYQVLAIIAPLITAPYISRVLHTDGVGLYSYTYTITTVFVLFAGLGFGSYGQREIAYHQDDIHQRSVIFYEIMFFRAVLTVIISALFIVFSLHYRQYTCYLLPQVLIIFALIFEMSWYFQGLENFRIIVTRNAIVKLATILCTFIFVRTEADIDKHILLHALSPLLSNIIYCAVIPRYIEKVSFSQLHPLRHLKGSIEFFLPLVAVQIYSYLDKLMLGFYMTTTVENGYYEQARKITQIIVTLIISLNTVMMSRISNLYANDQKEQIRKYYEKTFSIILMMLLPICVGLIFVSDNFVLWFFGAEFQKVGSLLKACSLLIALMCIGNFVGVQFLSPTGLQNKMTMAYAIAAASNVVMNMLLIPRLYSMGSLIASIIAEAVSCFIQVGLLLKSEYKFPIPRSLWKYTVATAVMAGVIVLEQNSVQLTGVISTIVDVIFGGVVYMVVLVLLKEENLQDIKVAIMQKIPRRLR